MNTFYFIRHAHANWSTDENRPLSKKGKQDAELVANILHRYPIAHIFSSPYRRARQTISPFAKRKKIDIHIEPELRERKLSEEPVGDFLSAVEKTWLNPDWPHPGGESNSQAQMRGLRVVCELNKQFSEEHIALSTHGNLLAVTLQRFKPSIDFSFWQSLTFPDIYKLAFTADSHAKIDRIWRNQE
jgi:2,3-bisphosphoglycerate-dependent phosphoglycerate mutase